MRGAQARDRFEPEARAKQSDRGGRQPLARGFPKGAAGRFGISRAPSARRISNSRCRAEPRANIRFAAFTQAIRSTNAHRARQKKQRRPDVARHLIMQQPGREAEFGAGSAIEWRRLPSFVAGIEIRILPLELRRERLQFGVRLIERDARPEPRNAMGMPRYWRVEIMRSGSHTSICSMLFTEGGRNSRKPGASTPAICVSTSLMRTDSPDHPGIGGKPAAPQARR